MLSTKSQLFILYHMQHKNGACSSVVRGYHKYEMFRVLPLIEHCNPRDTLVIEFSHLVTIVSFMVAESFKKGTGVSPSGEQIIGNVPQLSYRHEE